MGGGEQAIFKTQPGSNVTRGLYLDKHVHDNFRKCLSFFVLSASSGMFFCPKFGNGPFRTSVLSYCGDKKRLESVTRPGGDL